MKKVMPNDKCPCMSGKKYKFCCAKKQDFIKSIREVFGGEYIDTAYVLNDIAAKSDRVKKYLNDILPKINMQIIFVLNPKLDANMRACTAEGKESGAIIIKEIPIQEKDYFDLAHEFGHLLFAKKGYPGTYTSSASIAAMGTVLSNTIMDPMVNKMLYESGFDLVTYLKKGIKLQLPIFRNYPEESRLDLFQRHFLKCLIIEKELEWEIVNEEVLENEFKKIYQVKYPLIYNEAIDFIGYAKENGMDTPEKVKELFIKLRADNRMEQYIEIM